MYYNPYLFKNPLAYKRPHVSFNGKSPVSDKSRTRVWESVQSLKKSQSNSPAIEKNQSKSPALENNQSLHVSIELLPPEVKQIIKDIHFVSIDSVVIPRKYASNFLLLIKAFIALKLDEQGAIKFRIKEDEQEDINEVCSNTFKITARHFMYIRQSNGIFKIYLQNKIEKLNLNGWKKYCAKIVSESKSEFQSDQFDYSSFLDGYCLSKFPIIKYGSDNETKSVKSKQSIDLDNLNDVFQQAGVKIPGVSTPYVYFGAPRSSFPMVSYLNFKFFFFCTKTQIIFF
jgi:hypothetical protein